MGPTTPPAHATTRDINTLPGYWAFAMWGRSSSPPLSVENLGTFYSSKLTLRLRLAIGHASPLPATTTHTCHATRHHFPHTTHICTHRTLTAHTRTPSATTCLCVSSPGALYRLRHNCLLPRNRTRLGSASTSLRRHMYFQHYCKTPGNLQHIWCVCRLWHETVAT